MHILMMAGPVWFVCIFGSDPFNRTEYFYGLFYLLIVSFQNWSMYHSLHRPNRIVPFCNLSQNFGVSDSSTETLDLIPDAEYRETTDNLFVMIKFQMILSCLLWLMMLIVICKEKPLHEKPYTLLWKIFGA